MEHGRSSPDHDELLRRNRELTALVAEQRATIAAQQEALQRAAEQLALLKKALFSPRRERYVPSADQGLLFAAETPDAPLAEIPPVLSAPRPKSKPKHRRQFVIPEFLPQRRIEHALPESERPCGCCGEERVIIGEHVTRQIELTPAQAHVEVHVRYTYACKRCRSGEQVVTTSKPAAPIEKSPFGPSVLAWIISAKFERRLPLYRHQEMLLAPLGLWFSRPLLCQLLQGAARALKLLADRLLLEILLSYVVQADETPVRYLGGQPGKSLLGYPFGYGGDADHRYLWYDFRPRRSRDGPREVLGDFRGVLQTDGFSAYESLVSESEGRLMPAACWMHARRGFDEARYTTSHAIVEETLARIGLLYDVEERAKGLSFETRGALRAAESRPLVDGLCARWQEVRPELRPTSKLGDFEGDTVLGPPGTGGLATLVCRKSRLTIIAKVRSKNADHVHAKLTQRLKELDEERCHSITFDNGTEFARCHRLEKHLGIALYFADPGCPYQRGTNENTKGLIRQYFPKGTDFRDTSYHDVRQVEKLLNNRPRACLGFRTPAEVFFEKNPPAGCD